MIKASKGKAKKVPKKRVRAVGKAARILELLRRKEGATIRDLTKATGWQPHSVRGYLSAQVRKKLGLRLESAKGEGGQRVYKIES